MYERFYHLRERPFSLSPDPDYLYLSRVHEEALNYLRYGIEGHAGFVVITGEIGSGKTTLLQTLLRTLDRNVSVARIMNTMLEPHELVEAVTLDLGLETAGMSKPAMIRELGRYLVEQHAAGHVVLLVIDEAQNLTLPALEEVRMLSNLETEKSKLIQIVLVGQPDLRETLARPELEQMRQRITVSYHLQSLDADETRAYINHRLRKASIDEPLQFPADATRLIHARSHGLPRTINVICDSVLLFAFGEEKAAIDGEVVDFVISDLEVTGVLPSRHPPSRLTGLSTTLPGRLAVPGPQPLRHARHGADSLLMIVKDEDADLTNWIRESDESQDPVDGEREPAQATAESMRAVGLAEQQRVLAEEYRLLRDLTRRAQQQRGSSGGWPPFRRDAARRTAQFSARLAVTQERFVRLWDRVRRKLTGEPA